MFKLAVANPANKTLQIVTPDIHEFIGESLSCATKLLIKSVKQTKQTEKCWVSTVSGEYTQRNNSLNI